MPEPAPSSREVDAFLLEHIDTVPHLEALLLLWNSRPKVWTVNEMAEALFLAPASAHEILEDLMRENLIDAAPDTSGYTSKAERDPLLAAVDAAYRKELIRISRLIHSKPSAAVRAFARAFRMKKEHD